MPPAERDFRIMRWLSTYHKIVASSQEQLHKTQEPITLQNFSPEIEIEIRKALLEHSESPDYTDNASFLPISCGVSGRHKIVNILIFREQDFHIIDFGFSKHVETDQHIGGLSPSINLSLIERRPLLRLVSDSTVKDGIPVLSKWYLGWVSEKTIDNDYKPAVHLCACRVKVCSFPLRNPFPAILYTSFYSKLSDGRLGWAYFPIDLSEEDKFKKLFEKM